MLGTARCGEAVVAEGAAGGPAASPKPCAGPRNPVRRPRWLADREVAFDRLSLAVTGFLPVTLIALTAFGVADLRVLAVTLLVPALALQVGRRALRGPSSVPVLAALAAGIVATCLYDGSRFLFLWSGLMHGDPIPHIGVALHLHPAVVFGYLWRYLGNGAGLAVAFTSLGLRGVRAGIAFGLFVCGGLLLTLAVSPFGQLMLFPLNLTTIVMATSGHVIYGAVLGARVNGRFDQANSGSAGRPLTLTTSPWPP
jgi:hypothetical protein